MADDQLGVVQFIHPGKEQRKHRNGFCDWNMAVRSDKAWPHRRKFLLSNASFVRNGSDGEGLVGFWGEWEGPTFVRKLGRVRGPWWPHLIHMPAYYEPESYEGRLDTDPFVFGDRFLYCGCQQHTAHHRPGGAVPTFLKRLEVGSVILFGSSLGGRFVIDTVFVIAGWTEYQRGEYGPLEGIAPAEYYPLSLHPQALGNDTVKSFRLYTGATLADPVNGMYSFTPCRAADEVTPVFLRPTLELPDVITQNMTQGKKFSGMDESAVYAAWLEVKAQIEAQGCALAHHIDLDPKRVHHAS